MANDISEDMERIQGLIEQGFEEVKEEFDNILIVESCTCDCKTYYLDRPSLVTKRDVRKNY